MRFTGKHRRQAFLKVSIRLSFVLLLAFSARAQISGVSPTPNALHVPANTSISVSFAQEMNAGTINGTTFRVWGAQSGLHAGTVSYDAASKKTTFTPALPFFPGEMVYVALTNGITTAAGQPLNKFAWHFTVAVKVSSGLFVNKRKLSVGTAPRSVCGADLDKDGDVDLAVANNGGNTVSILKNNGDATFQEKQDYVVGYYPASVTAADWDGDGDMDLTVAHSDGRVEEAPSIDTDSVTVLHNNGDGSFHNRRRYAVARNSPSLAAADIDGDGDFDLTVPNEFIGHHTATIFKNNGSGLFNDKLIVTAGIGPQAAFSSDVDNDGDMDIVVANNGWEHGGGTNGSVSVIKNNEANFQSRVDYPAGFSPRGIFVADVDQDRDGDLIVGGFSTIGILKNKGDGSFQPVSLTPAGTSLQFISAADVDGDGDVDVAMVDFYIENKISIFKNKGDGTFLPKQSYAVGVHPWALFAADLDRDGDADLAVAGANSKSVSILINGGLGLANPAVLNFGEVYVGHQKELSWTLYNYTNSSVNVANVTSNNPTFTLVGSTNFNVGAGDSAKIAVRYAPTSVTSDTGSVTIFPGGFPTERIAVSGTGLTPVAVISANPTSLAFGNVSIAKTSDLILNLSNPGVADLQITNITHNNPHFAVVGGPALTIRPQETKSLVVRFTAPFIGNQIDTLKFFSNDASKNPLKIPLNAIGSVSAWNEISVQAPQLLFDSVTVHQTKTLSLKIYNRGAANLAISKIASNNENFKILTATSLTLLPNDSSAVNVQFSPLVVGAQTGILAITSNDANEKVLSLPMSGTGKAITTQAPILLGISPNKGNRLQTLNVGCKGVNFLSGVTSVVVGTDIKVNSVTVHRPDSLTANITIAATAATGERNFLVVKSGANGGTSAPKIFTVNNPAPTLTAKLTPANGKRLQTFNVGFKGTNFISGVTRVNAGAGITVNRVTVHRPDSMTANLTIAVNAATGVRNIFVSNAAPGGGASGNRLFWVNNPIPTLVSLTPNAGAPGQKLNVKLIGSKFINGVTSVKVGAGITVNSTTMNSTTSLTINVTIASDAALGPRNFSILNAGPGGGTSVAKTFTVLVNSQPGKPNLLLPVQNQILPLSKTAPALKFVWSKAFARDANDTLKYAVNLQGPALDITFAAVWDTSVLLPIMPLLKENSEYSWNVEVSDGVATMTWPERATFRTSNAITSMQEGNNLLPSEFHLEQNYPNPFAVTAKYAATTIKYQLPQTSFVTLKIFDMLGREIIALVNAQQAPGYYNATWNGRNAAGQLVPGGIYLCRLQAGSFERVMKMMVVR